MNRSIILLAAGTLLAIAACSEATVDSTTSTPSLAVPLSTSSTTSSSTTPTTVPTPTVSLILDQAPDELVAAVNDLYLWIINQSIDPPDSVATTLVEGLAGIETNTLSVDIAGAAHLGVVLETEIAVVTADEDVLLAVNDGGWRIVGARLNRFDSAAIFGESPRLLFVIGSDARPGEDQLRLRADSLHIVSTSPADADGAIVGIPRDSWVEASYGGNAKFTNVMASRGPEVVVETAEILTGLEFEGYVVTGFRGFVDLVDAFGGFILDIPFAMAEPKSKAYFSAGEQHVDGADALAFARNRTIAGGDLTRQLHHGLIMKAALLEAQRRGIGELPALLEILTEHAWTNLSAEDLLTLAASAYELNPITLTNIVAPGTVGTAGAASVVHLDDDAQTIFDDLQDGLLDN